MTSKHGAMQGRVLCGHQPLQAPSPAVPTPFSQLFPTGLLPVSAPPPAPNQATTQQKGLEAWFRVGAWALQARCCHTSV